MNIIHDTTKVTHNENVKKTTHIKLPKSKLSIPIPT